VTELECFSDPVGKSAGGYVALPGRSHARSFGSIQTAPGNSKKQECGALARQSMMSSEVAIAIFMILVVTAIYMVGVRKTVSPRGDDKLNSRK
jgi:hypothetical protein